MNRGLAAGLIALAVVAVTGLVFYAVMTGAKPSASDFTASPSSRTTASPAPSADPCHRGGVTYCALNPAVTEATIRTTIRVSGWTATVRLPEGNTEPLKLQQMASEELGGSASDYEEGRRMPLELGGDPRDVTNLSPESRAELRQGFGRECRQARGL